MWHGVARHFVAPVMEDKLTYNGLLHAYSAYSPISMYSETQFGVHHLKRLILLRNVAVAGQALTICFVHFGLEMTLPLYPNLLILILLLAGNLWAWSFLSRGANPEAKHFASQLGFDILGLTALLYLNGGYTNPFAFLYLLPLAVAATLLPARYVWSLALLAIGGYSLTMFLYLPLPPYSGIFGDSFHLHLVGMWISFVIGAGIIAVFIEALARNNRQHQAELSKAREAALHNEKIVALGALAAGTAHELSTPLSTIAVLANDLTTDLRERGLQDSQEYRDLRILTSQINRCKELLDSSLDISGSPRALQAEQIALDAFVDSLINQWREQHQDVEVKLQWLASSPTPELILDQTFRLTIINLLNNAREADATEINCSLDWNAEQIGLTLQDNGRGIEEQTARKAGIPHISDKGEGRGLGLFLTKSLINRLGGEFLIQPHDGGTLVRIRLSRQALSA